MLSGSSVSTSLAADQLLERFLTGTPRQRRSLVATIQLRLAELLPLIDDRLDGFDATADDWASGWLLQLLAAADSARLEALLQRYPCRGNDARWSSDDAIAFLETKARWLDAALETWEVDGEAIADDSDVIEAKTVVLVVPEKPGQTLRSEVLDVLIPVES
jgi:hypothetical protein